MSLYVGAKTAIEMRVTARHDATTAGHTKAWHNSWNENMDRYRHKHGLCLNIASMCCENHLLNQRLGGQHEALKLPRRLHMPCQIGQ